jgi:hypothetical protein
MVGVGFDADGARGVITRARTELGRLQTILRCVLFVCARHWLETARLPPVRPSRVEAPRPARPAVARLQFLLPRRMRLIWRATNAPPPPRLVAADAARLIARRMEALARVLAAPMPQVRRIARRLTRETFLARAPARRTPSRRVGVAEDHAAARRLLWWALSPQNRFVGRRAPDTS